MRPSWPRLRLPRPPLVHAALQTLGVTLIAVGVSLVYLPAGLIAAGVGIVVLSVAAEVSP